MFPGYNVDCVYAVLNCVFSTSETHTPFLFDSLSEIKKSITTPPPKGRKVIRDASNLVDTPRITATFTQNYYGAIDLSEVGLWSPNNKASIGNFFLNDEDSGYFNEEDLNSFYLINNIGLQQRNNITFVSASPSDLLRKDWDPIDGEANLDIQLTVGVSPGIQIDAFHSRGAGDIVSIYTNLLLTNNLLSGLMFALQNESPKPLTFSLSYGGDERSYNTSTLNHFNEQFMALGAIGISLFASSG